MQIYLILFYVSAIVWLFPPIKQYSGKFFYYFLIQALSDPVAIVLRLFSLHSLPLYIVKDLLMILLFWKPENLKKWWPGLIPTMVLVFYVSDMFHYTIMDLILVLLHIVILYFILKMAGADIMEFKVLKIFYVLIILYELSIILKFIFALVFGKTGLGYFFLTTAFEILLGVLFTFIGEGDRRLSFQLSEKPAAPGFPGKEN